MLRRNPVTLFAALFFPLFLLYTSTASYDGLQVNDAIAAAVPAWTLANEGTLTLPESAPVNRWFVEAKGRQVSNRFPGVIGFAVPFYWLTRGSASQPTIPEGTLAAAFAAALAVSLMAFALRRVVDTRVAVAGALLFGLGTTTWTVAGATLFSHAPAQLWLTLGLVAAASSRWWLSAPAYAAAILTRPHLVLAPAVTAVWVAWRDRMWRAACWLLLGCALGLGLVMLYNHHVFGYWSVRGGYELPVAEALGRNPLDLAGNVIGVLFSPSRGLLGFSPFVLLLLCGIRPAWRAAPSWARGAGLGAVAYLLLQLQANRFSGGTGFYGYRLPLEPLTLAAPLLVLAYTEWVARSARLRRAFAVLAGYSVACQVLGAIWFGVGASGTHDSWWGFPQWGALGRAGVLGAAVSVAAGVAFVRVAARATATPAAA